LGAFGAQATFFFLAVIKGWRGECDFEISGVEVVRPGIELFSL
jgi:hypothetical protein